MAGEVDARLETMMRWIAESPAEVEAPAQVGYVQALQLERIADATERIADALERDREKDRRDAVSEHLREMVGGD